MKKIDLHIHTISTDSDHNFDFCLERLKKYVSDTNLHCIAITNHNLFDLKQFKLISEALTICVLPGIEIDLEGGQLLLIGDGEDLDDFSEMSKHISNKCTSKISISIVDFKTIYQDLSKYILIPHYEKNLSLKMRLRKT